MLSIIGLAKKICEGINVYAGSPRTSLEWVGFGWGNKVSFVKVSMYMLVHTEPH
jgi:hypothetical protein